MAQANDSVLVTPGSGATIATQLVNSKEHQVTMQADASGHILGSKPIYHYTIPNQVFVNTANTVHFDMFNADASLVVRVLSVRFIPDIVTAVTGVSVNWLLERSSAVGTGGTAQTAWPSDSGQAALDADITCRSKPTGGATAGTDIRPFALSSEETNAATIQIASQGGLELVPPLLDGTTDVRGHGIVLRQNEGIRLVQVTATVAGNAAFLIGFTVE
jgi:hypothetical protein